MLQSLWETIWSFLTKLNISFPYKSEIPFLGIYLSEMKIFSHEDSYINVLFSFIHNSPKLEIPQMSFNKLMDKQIVAYLKNI